MPIRGQREDLRGRRFGRLTAVEYAGHSQGSRVSLWRCVCDCGGSTTSSAYNLKIGNSGSCGCRRKETLAGYATHGASKTAEYRSWLAMKKRCGNPMDKHYADYGGRGVAVCERWRQSFENFLADMGTKPSPAHTLDRIDNDGNYEPGNCRWATIHEQASNRRNNRIIEFENEKATIQEWSRRLGITISTLDYRLRAWPMRLAMTLPHGSAVRRRPYIGAPHGAQLQPIP